MSNRNELIADAITAAFGDPANIDNRNELLRLLAGSIGSLDIVFVRDFPYVNNAPVETVDEDTGVIAASLAPNTDVTISIIFTDGDNEELAATVRIDNDLAKLQPGLWQLRTVEPPFSGGKLEFAARLDADGNYHYKLDQEGGSQAITLDRVAVATKTIKIGASL